MGRKSTDETMARLREVARRVSAPQEIHTPRLDPHEAVAMVLGHTRARMDCITGKFVPDGDLPTIIE